MDFIFLSNDYKHWPDWEMSLYRNLVTLGTQREIIAIVCFYVSPTINDPDRVS